MSKIVRVYESGGPNVLKFEGLGDIGKPGPQEVLIQHETIGVNLLDIQLRSGIYPMAKSPITLGLEAAGTITDIGIGVRGLQVGDRVAYATQPLGSYCSERILPATRVFKLPDSISFAQAAAVMAKGITAWYLVNKTYEVKAGDFVLLHAAAGGVGTMASEWMNSLGATVIGTVGSAAKVEVAKRHGCEHVINYESDDFEKSVLEITEGKGVSVVYDGVGIDTFEGSLNCLKPRGLLVSLGFASGRVPPFDLSTLAKKGALYITRTSFRAYTENDKELAEGVHALFDLVRTGVIEAAPNQSYAFEDVAQAHADISDRKNVGSTILVC